SNLSKNYEATFKEQEKYRKIISNLIQNRENLLPNDIVLLSYIFFLFKDEQQAYIINKIEEKMYLWKDYYGISKTISLFYYHLGTLYNLVLKDTDIAFNYYIIELNKVLK